LNSKLVTPSPTPAPPEYRIVVAKQARQLSLWSGSGLESTYAIVLGRNSAADKSVEGDQATPLGEFYICAKNPRSKYFLSLCISYPNAEDAERGLAAGLIGADEHRQILGAIRAGRMPPQHTRLGGEIYIHGYGGHGAGRGSHSAGDCDQTSAAGGHDARNDLSQKDWTRGCIALSNADMQDLYDRVAIGTAVVITA
jgi:murein L,D-transpeptidase YafK